VIRRGITDELQSAHRTPPEAANKIPAGSLVPPRGHAFSSDPSPSTHHSGHAFSDVTKICVRCAPCRTVSPLTAAAQNTPLPETGDRAVPLLPLLRPRPVAQKPRATTRLTSRVCQFDSTQQGTPFLIEEENGVALANRGFPARQGPPQHIQSLETIVRRMLADPLFAASRASEQHPRAAARQFHHLEQPAWRLPGTRSRILSSIWRILRVCSSHLTSTVGIRCSTPTGARRPPQ
jgi:hypothetical protein